MPTTDLDNSAGWAGWLQSLLQNQGAAQPYSPGGAPAGGAGPQGLMPGGGALGYQATTPGQPSMGYPAVGQAAGRPSVAPGMQQPAAPFFQFGGFHPGNILQSHPPGSASLGPVFNASGSPGGPGPGPGGPGSAGNDGGFNNPYQAAAGANPAQGGIGSDARFPIAGPLAAPAAGPMDPSIIARKRLMTAATPAATSTAPPSAAQSPFTQVQRPNLPATGYSSGDRMMTALNLARLLGRA